MNTSFNETKDSTSDQSDRTPRITPAFSNQTQGTISTSSSWLPPRQTSTINNRISTSDTRHRTSFLQTTRMQKSQLQSAMRGIHPDPFLHTGEDTIREEQDVRADALTHQQYPPNQAYESRDQDRPQYSSPVRRSPRISNMAEEMRERNKSSNMFTSMQKLKNSDTTTMTPCIEMT